MRISIGGTHCLEEECCYWRRVSFILVLSRAWCRYLYFMMNSLHFTMSSLLKNYSRSFWSYQIIFQIRLFMDYICGKLASSISSLSQKIQNMKELSLIQISSLITTPLSYIRYMALCRSLSKVALASLMQVEYFSIFYCKEMALFSLYLSG